jgi:hypothetical protein
VGQDEHLGNWTNCIDLSPTRNAIQRIIGSVVSWRTAILVAHSAVVEFMNIEWSKLATGEQDRAPILRNSGCDYGHGLCEDFIAAVILM